MAYFRLLSLPAGSPAAYGEAAADDFNGDGKLGVTARATWAPRKLDVVTQGRAGRRDNRNG
jgi:hypothetical protein